jgi:hypothetical protein
MRPNERSLSLNFRALVPRVTAQHVARIAVVGLLLAIIRSLAEYARLRYVRGASVTMEELTPYVYGALGASVGELCAVLALFASRWRVVMVIVGLTVVAMFVYKVAAIGASF